MRKTDAVRLRPGEREVVQNDMFEERATVVHVTPAGGVLVRGIDGRKTWHPYSRAFYEG